MKPSPSNPESHAFYCPIKNVKSALFVVASFTVITFVSWTGLDKPLAHPRLDLRLIGIYVLAMVTYWLVVFTCVRERLLLGITIISLLKMEVQGFAPSVFSKYVELVKSGELALALIGLFVSLSMLIEAARSPRAGPSNAGTGGTTLDS